ncbi:hypothetical protein [Parapedobacter tibetensis]|uniref:hypothetical protein n=1 Tax=Parapedobacter tibetensis TaxID=2972951 RepID=UPI00214D7B3C|nr:hypothetical protein [Parapedobacter tibetensis]
MNKLILKLLLLPTALWKRMGVDTEKLRLILEVKLTLDDRRPFASMGQSSSKKKGWSGNTFLQFLVMAVMGAMLMAYFFMVSNSYVAYSLYFFSMMCVLALMLIADLSTILIDPRDQYIILPRPVDDRTFAVSRILHIGVLLMGLLIGLVLPGLVYTAITQGIVVGLVFIFQVFTAGILTLLLVNQFYLMMIKWLSARRLKDLVSMLQVVFTVVVISAYYFGPILLRQDWVQQLRVEETPWLWVFPPVWIASLQQLAAQSLSWLMVVLSLLGVTTPMVSLWLVVRIFATGFNDKVAAMATGDGQRTDTDRPSKRKWGSRLSPVLTRSPLESAGFNIVWLITGRSREFKQKLYPTLAYIPVYFVFFFFFGFGKQDTPRSFEDKLEQMRDGSGFILLFYLSLFTLISAYQYLTQHEQFKAAWVYRAAPVSSPGVFMAGVLKAVLTKFFYPFILGLLLLGVPIAGFGIINDALLAAAIGSIEAILVALFTMKAYPFSQPIKLSGSNFMTTLLIMGGVGVLGYAHYVFIRHELLVWVACLVAWGIFAVMLHRFRKEEWEALRA